MRFTRFSFLTAACLSLAAACVAGDDPGIYNGSFEKTARGGRVPDGWQAAGEKSIVQELTVEKDPQRGQVARLQCTHFVPGTPASHAMICQYGHVALQSGHLYRLSLWAKSEDLDGGVVQINLVNSRGWASSGLTASFLPGSAWQQFEFTFRAERDIPKETSRLAMYFLSTGTLWLDDVAIEEIPAVKRQWRPVVPMQGVTNALLNSSFETGEGWGCSAGKPISWIVNLFQRVGQWDDLSLIHI